MACQLGRGTGSHHKHLKGTVVTSGVALFTHPHPCLSAFLFHRLHWKSTMAVLGLLALSMYQALSVSPVLSSVCYSSIHYRSSPGLMQVSPSSYFISSSHPSIT